MAETEMEKKVDRIYDALMGMNGNPGLLHKVEELAESHYKLKNRFFMMVAFFIGTGTIGVGALVKLFLT